ncbi:MAG: pyridoxamine 5'-phosphate oxidase family protein [Anaerolineae bacterium]|nr:pyridoxamine 5'-phosphate oxidase family protein [Anaerolineae bacterium]
MGKVFDHIPADQIEFIKRQHIFFVATAPLGAEGHVNVSPKGLDVFRVLGSNRVAYLDLTGSGNETSAHLLENGRITLMFCAFEGPANILRLYGTGHSVLPNSPEWDELFPHFTEMLSMRQIVVADIDRVQTSCGYAVPFMDYVEDRETLTKYWENKGAEKIPAYQAEKNFVSIDGLPTPLAVVHKEQS